METASREGQARLLVYKAIPETLAFWEILSDKVYTVLQVHTVTLEG